MAESLGFPQPYRDPVWFEVLDRLLERLEARHLKATFFVVGKDLEYLEVKARVRELCEAGHEIANHSFSHPMNLGSRRPDEQREEIRKAHEIIGEITGKAPRGFLAPAWCSSPVVTDALMELDYLYDASPFPSFWLWPMWGKMTWELLRTPERLGQAFFRKDLHRALTHPSRPEQITSKEGKSLLKLPLQTASRLLPPLWHSMAFLKGPSENWFRNYLEQLAAQREGFYYLLHPADFFVAEDFPDGRRGKFWRMDVSLERKLALLEEALDVLASTGRPVVTMEELARGF